MDNRNNFLVFSTGSHQGSTSCGAITIINDEETELPEDFTLSLVPQNQNTIIEPTRSQITVTIEDDDSKTNHSIFNLVVIFSLHFLFSTDCRIHESTKFCF